MGDLRVGIPIPSKHGIRNQPSTYKKKRGKATTNRASHLVRVAIGNYEERVIGIKV